MTMQSTMSPYRLKYCRKVSAHTEYKPFKYVTTHTNNIIHVAYMFEMRYEKSCIGRNRTEEKQAVK